MTVSSGEEIVPRVAVRTPASIFNKVDLPAPFLPIRAMRSPSLMTKLIYFSNLAAKVQKKSDIRKKNLHISKKNRTFARRIDLLVG